MGDLIQQAHPDAKLVFVGRSDEESPKVRFALEQVNATYVKNSFADPADCAKAIIEARVDAPPPSSASAAQMWSIRSL